jgi:hypothetical protein
MGKHKMAVDPEACADIFRIPRYVILDCLCPDHNAYIDPVESMQNGFPRAIDSIASSALNSGCGVSKPRLCSLLGRQPPRR